MWSDLALWGKEIECFRKRFTIQFLRKRWVEELEYAWWNMHWNGIGEKSNGSRKVRERFVKRSNRRRGRERGLTKRRRKRERGLKIDQEASPRHGLSGLYRADMMRGPNAMLLRLTWLNGDFLLVDYNWWRGQHERSPYSAFSIVLI